MFVVHNCRNMNFIDRKEETNRLTSKRKNRHFVSLEIIFPDKSVTFSATARNL